MKEEGFVLHPPAQEISPYTLIAGPTQPTNKAFFLSIDEQEIQKAANRTSGDLREAIAAFTRKLASEVLDPHTLEAYTAGRLIALNKAPGKKELQVRPMNRQSADLQRTVEQLSQSGASSWLGALPIAAQGFNLNKGEFQDSLCLRYKMPIKNLPSKCP